MRNKRHPGHNSIQPRNAFLNSLRDQRLAITTMLLCFALLSSPASGARQRTSQLISGDLDAARLIALERTFRESRDELPDPALLGVSEWVAYEEHPQFVYAVGRSRPISQSATTQRWRHVVLWRPALLVVAEWTVPVQDEKPSDREGTVIGPWRETKRERTQCTEGEHVLDCIVIQQALAPPDNAKPEAQHPSLRLQVCRLLTAPGEPTELDVTSDESDSAAWTIRIDQHRLRLVMPAPQPGNAMIEAASEDGEILLASRLLPAGLMPAGHRGVELLERWDSAYRGNQRPGWDVGRPASDLKRAVEQELIQPGRLVEFGSGSGGNAIYLAGQGFDVTAIDVAPTALGQARAQADRAGVSVRWLLADVTAPPELEPFDVVFDRGCYHGVRRDHAHGYVQSLRRLTRPGSRILILAGNANEQRQTGPPRVSEQELRDDFSEHFRFVRLEETRFDSAGGDRDGALAWFILLERKDDQP